MNKQDTGKFAIYYALFFIAAGIFPAYIPLFYQSKGFNLSEIGILTAIGPILTICVQPFWAKLCDKVKFRVTVLAILIVGNMIAGFFFSLSSNRIVISILTVLYMIFNTALVPIVDTIATEHFKKSGGRYSIARIGGSLGYILSVVCAGIYFNQHLEHMFYIQTVLYGILLIYVLIVARDKNEIRATKATKNLSVLKNKEFLIILAFYFCLNFAFCLKNTYLSVFITELGCTNEFVGYSFGLAALSEVPILVIIPRLYRRFGVYKLLYLSGFAYTLKIFIAAYSTDIKFVLLAQMLQGIAYIPLLFSTISYVSETLPDDLKTFGQGILAVVGTGLGSITGNLVGGFLSNSYGIATTYKITSLFMLLATLLFIVISRIFTKKSIYKIS